MNIVHSLAHHECGPLARNGLIDQPYFRVEEKYLCKHALELFVEMFIGLILKFVKYVNFMVYCFSVTWYIKNAFIYPQQHLTIKNHTSLSCTGRKRILAWSMAHAWSLWYGPIPLYFVLLALFGRLCVLSILASTISMRAPIWLQI